jgi:isocitrate dehydrogenase (NAD+)
MRSLLKTSRRFFSQAKSGMFLHNPNIPTAQHVTVIPGHHIGPELTNSVMKVFDVAEVPLNFDVINNFDFNTEEHKKQLNKNQFILLGNLGQKGSRYVEHLDFYKYLDLFARVTHVYNLPNVKSKQKDLNIVIFRENLESEYSGVEHEVVDGVFESLKIVTKCNSLKIAEYAFQYAFFTGRKKVTAVHKANIMKMADGMFLQATREVAKKYPSIKYEEIIIDNCAMQMVKNPQQFDVMVMPNLYGSIITSIGAGLVGGPALIPGASVGSDYMLFDQACRNSGMNITGKNLANPTALILSASEMLKSMHLNRYAELITDSVWNVYEEGKHFIDSNDDTHTTEFIERLCEEILVLKKRM